MFYIVKFNDTLHLGNFHQHCLQDMLDASDLKQALIITYLPSLIYHHGGCTLKFVKVKKNLQKSEYILKPALYCTLSEK